MFGLFRRPTTIADANHADDLITRERHRLAAEAAILDADRHALLLDGSPDEIAAHDAARARVSIALEQLEANLERLRVDREEAAARDMERRAVYAAAQKRRTEGVEALKTYGRAAREAAEALVVLRAVDQQITVANRNLPEGMPALDLAEPFNGYVPPERSTRTITREVVVDRQSGLPVDGPHVFDPRRHRVEMQKVEIEEPGGFGRDHDSIANHVRLPGIGNKAAFYP